MSGRVDPTTGRPFGDHGTAQQAIDFALDHEGDDPGVFLREWREGGTAEEWPEFYVWLAKQDAKR